MLARDFEDALEKIVEDGWGWQHIEEGEDERALAHPRVADEPAGARPARGRRSSRSAPGRGSSSASSTGRASARSTSRRCSSRRPPLRSAGGRARRQGRGARAPDRLARLRRERRRAAERLRRVRAARAARRPRPRARDEGEAQRTPRRSPWTCSSPGRSASRRRAPTTRPAAAAASRISRTRRRSRRRRRRCATRWRGSAGSPSRPLEPIVPAEEVFGYRNKLEYSFTRTPSGPALGFHQAGRWDEVLEIEKCWLTTDLGNAIRNAVREWAREECLEAYDQADARGLPAPSRRSRGAQHRPGARPARDRARARSTRARSSRRCARSRRCGRSTTRSTTGRPR